MPASDAGLGTSWDRLQGALNTLMTDYMLPWVVDAKNNASVLLSMIPEASEKIAGKYVFQPVKFGRNTDAVSAVREGGKLPDPGSAKARPYMFRPRMTFYRAIITGDIMRAASMDLVKFLDPFQDILDQGADDMAVELNRQLHNDGSGRIAEVQAIAGGGLGANQIDIRLNQSIESVATCSSSPAQFLGGDYLGRRVLIVSAAGVPRGVRRIISIDSESAGPPSTARVTLGDAAGVGKAQPAGIAIGDWIVSCARFVDDAVISGEQINSAFRTELPGIAGIFSDSFVLDGNGVAVLPAGAMSYVGQDEFSATSGATVGFQGAPVDATAPWNQAIVMDNGGGLRDPAEELIQIGFDRAEETNNAQIDLILSGYGERSRFAEILKGDRSYTNTTTLKGGWTAIDMKGKPWVVDRHCLKNRLYLMGLASGGFRQYPRTPFQPLDPLGPQWYRLQDDDKYQGAWVMEGTHGVDIRQRCGVLITDIRRSA